MATALNFGDRFSYPAENGVGGIDAVTAQSLTDVDLELESPELKEMAAIVRSYSVLLRRKTTLEIFNIITQQSDPRIALVLAAAKRREDNLPLFAGLGAVKEIMFADTARVPAGTGFVNRDLFSDGIRRVSAGLTAATLIAQLSQVSEQATHARVVEQQALADLDRIVQTYELSTAGSSSTTSTADENDEPIAFYFEPKNFTIPAGKKLKVEWQSPGISSAWALVGEFEGATTTAQVLLQLVDNINGQTILNPDTTILAAAELSGPYLTNPRNPSSTQYHTMLFYPRKPAVGLIAYSINVRITLELEDGETDTTQSTFPVGTSPFIWGPYGDSLNNYSANGCLVLIRFNRLTTNSSGAASDDEDGYQPIVLYFRRRSETVSTGHIVPPDTAQVVFRVQPWQPRLNEGSELAPADVVTIDIPRLLVNDPLDVAAQEALDDSRYSQVAVAVLNKMAELNLDTKATGALISNDPLLASDPSAGLELVAWSVSYAVTHIVLDVLQVPEDIEIAVGDRLGPRTMYSSNPKSLRVPNPFSSSAPGAVDGVLKAEQAYVLKKEKSRLWSSILDEAKATEDPLWL